MYLTRKNNILFIVGILVVMLVVGPILFFVLHPERFIKKEDKNTLENQAPVVEKKAPFDEEKPARTQEEIWTEYAKNINNLLNLVNTSEENVEVILFKMEAVFLNTTVPSEERELYLKTFLQIQKLKSDGVIDSKEKLREYTVPLLTALMNRE